jgi:hypothetical protein
MTFVSSGLYRALLAAQGVSKELAGQAAEELADCQRRLTRLDAVPRIAAPGMGLIALVGLNILLNLLILGVLFRGDSNGGQIEVEPVA